MIHPIIYDSLTTVAIHRMARRYVVPAFMFRDSIRAGALIGLKPHEVLRDLDSILEAAPIIPKMGIKWRRHS